MRSAGGLQICGYLGARDYRVDGYGRTFKALRRRKGETCGEIKIFKSNHVCRGIGGKMHMHRPREDICPKRSVRTFSLHARLISEGILLHRISSQRLGAVTGFSNA